jgi:hypothetical protein
MSAVVYSLSSRFPGQRLLTRGLILRFRAVFLGDTYLFNPDRSSWANLTGPVMGSPPAPRIEHGFTSAADGAVYSFGGFRPAGEYRNIEWILSRGSHRSSESSHSNISSTASYGTFLTKSAPFVGHGPEFSTEGGFL